MIVRRMGTWYMHTHNILVRRHLIAMLGALIAASKRKQRYLG